MTVTTQTKLDALSELYSQRDALALEKAALVAQIVPEEIQRALNDVDVEYNFKQTTLADNIAELEKQIKDDVIVAGETAKGAHLMAVWSKGRVTWDGKKLDGMMSIIPALKDARKEGEPSVSIRKV